MKLLENEKLLFMFLVFYYFYSLYISFCWNQIFIFAIFFIFIVSPIARVFCNSLFKCLVVPSGSLNKSVTKEGTFNSLFAFDHLLLHGQHLTTTVLDIFLVPVLFHISWEM